MATSNPPMSRPSVRFLDNATNATSKVVTTTLVMTAVFSARLSGIGMIKAVAPGVKKILNIFDPSTLPSTMPTSRRRAAAMDAINSGKDVPGPTITRPITRSDMPRLFAIPLAPSTMNSPPNPHRPGNGRRTPPGLYLTEVTLYPFVSPDCLANDSPGTVD
jgi:hypothetical protein